MWNNSRWNVIIMRSLHILFVVPVVWLAVEEEFNGKLGYIMVLWAFVLIIVEIVQIYTYWKRKDKLAYFTNVFTWLDWLGIGCMILYGFIKFNEVALGHDELTTLEQ